MSSRKDLQHDKSFQRLHEETEAEANVNDWTAAKVGEWLRDIGLGEHGKTFEQHRITGDLLHCLSENHLKEMGITLVGQRITLLRETQRIHRHAVNKVRFAVLWETDAEVYTKGPADWCYKQCCCEECLETPDHYKLTSSSLSLTVKQKRVGCCQAKARATRNIDLSNIAGVSEFHRNDLCDCGCAADWIYIELDGKEKQLEAVAPLTVKRGTGDDVALKIQMAMEEAQAAAALGSVGHNASMQRA